MGAQAGQQAANTSLPKLSTKLSLRPGQSSPTPRKAQAAAAADARTSRPLPQANGAQRVKAATVEGRVLLSLQHGPMHPQDMWQETTGCFPSRSSACFFISQKGEQQGPVVPANGNECVEVAGGSVCLISGDGYPFWSMERAEFSVSGMRIKVHFHSESQMLHLHTLLSYLLGQRPLSPASPQNLTAPSSPGAGGPCATDPETGAQRGS